MWPSVRSGVYPAVLARGPQALPLAPGCHLPTSPSLLSFANCCSSESPFMLSMYSRLVTHFPLEQVARKRGYE